MAVLTIALLPPNRSKLSFNSCMHLMICDMMWCDVMWCDSRRRKEEQTRAALEEAKKEAEDMVHKSQLDAEKQRMYENHIHAIVFASFLLRSYLTSCLSSLGVSLLTLMQFNAMLCLLV